MNILCIRFSAIGDVAMTAPVIKAFATENPEVSITMVSRPFAKAFFEGLAPNVSFVGVDLKDNRYRGMHGLFSLYNDLKELKPDFVCDLHDVLRTKFLRMRFRMAGVKVAHINKHRSGKRALTRPKNKVMVQQPTSFENYAEVLKATGLSIGSADGILDLCSINVPISVAPKAIGIAPFAAHEGKIYPTEMMQEVLSKLVFRHPDLQILLFGGGKREQEVFDRWTAMYEGVIFASEKCNGMREEMALMQRLRCMLTMDSGNMHMASLVGTPVVSVWGATHPMAGFMGWKQCPDNAVQLDMPCRPCSIYGNKPCLRGDYACLNDITPEMILDKIEQFL